MKIKGLAPGEDIVSIDSRAANGLLYGLTKQNTLYTLNPYSGVATKVGPAGTPDLALVGKAFAIDFNPSVDRLRVVTDAAQNLRINPLTGVVVYLPNYSQGWMNAKPFKVGDRAWSGAALAEIPDLSTLEMEGKLEEIDRGRMAAGATVRVRVDALPEVTVTGVPRPSCVFEGEDR